MTSAPDIDALVKKLRNPFVYENGEMDEDVVFADMLKAADALTALQADMKAARERAEKAEWESFCLAETALKFETLTESAEARLAQARRTGKLLANAAFNISRMDLAHITVVHLLSLKNAQEEWDRALTTHRGSE